MTYCVTSYKKLDTVATMIGEKSGHLGCHEMFWEVNPYNPTLETIIMVSWSLTCLNCYKYLKEFMVSKLT